MDIYAVPVECGRGQDCIELSLNEQNRAIVVNLDMDKAYEALSDCDALMQMQRWSAAANRMYYAIFHAVCALFVNDGYLVKTHKGVSVMFNSQYLNTGRVPQGFGQLLSQLETIREKGDYDAHYKVDPDALREKFPQAKEMINTIAEMVK